MATIEVVMRDGEHVMSEAMSLLKGEIAFTMLCEYPAGHVYAVHLYHHGRIVKSKYHG